MTRLRDGFVAVGRPNDGAGRGVIDNKVERRRRWLWVGDGRSVGAVNGAEEIAALVNVVEVGSCEIGRYGAAVSWCAV